MGRREPRMNVVLSTPAGRASGSSRMAPSAELAPLVEWIWTAWWDLAGRPAHDVAILTDTRFHIVFEAAGANVVGVVTRTFTRRLEGVGRVVGVKLKPGAFRSLARLPARDFTDRRVALRGALVHAEGIARATGEVLAAGDDAGRAAAVERFLRARLPAPDPRLTLVQAAVARVEADRRLVAVETLAGEVGVSVRTLQRLFQDYIGVGPKWVIRRSRLLEAAERLQDGRAVNVARLAAALGYFDQSHLAREFKALVGQPPAGFARRAVTSGRARPSG